MDKLYTFLLTLSTFFSMLFQSCREENNKLTYPQTRKDLTVIDNFFGVEIADPYRWLEEESEEVAAWVKAQNKVTESYLSQIPYRTKINKRLTEIWNYPKYSTPIKKGDNYFFFKNDGLQNQSVLYVQKDLNSEPQVLIDPNTFSKEGTSSLSNYSISSDSKYIAYSKSEGGSDWNEIFVMEVETKNHLKDHLKWIKFSGISWFKDGFFYSKYNQPDKGQELSSQNVNHSVYYHKIGTPQSEDIIIFQDTKNPLRNHYATVTECEKYLIVYASQGTYGSEVYIKDLSKGMNANFVKIVSGFNYDNSVIENNNDIIYLLTNEDAPLYRLVAIDMKKPSKSNWITVIPEREIKLESVSMVGGKLICTYLKDASSRVFVHNMDGTLENEITLPSIGSVYGFTGQKNDSTVFYSFTSFTYPPSIYSYNIANKTSSLYRASELQFDIDNYETKQLFYTSKDGTKVPMFIVHKKGLKLDGNNPVFLYGYGGFNISLLPTFNVARMIFLEQGGIYAMPSLRGGGEYGEKWHQEGMLLNKQNVFDDFIAAAEFLISKKYTNPSKIAIQGGSNGGLLVGAVMTQRPDLFKVAIPSVGVLDMLRFHKFTIGHAWVVEYGSSETEEHFHNLLSYSPLHNLKEGVEYPATLVTTADHDDRVVPAHSYKFIATLQEKYKGDRPMLIKVDTKAGHGAGKSTEMLIEEWTDKWSFIFKNLGVDYK